MADNTEKIKAIIPAGEVGAYTVCPEAWRLRSLVRVSHEKKQVMKDGQRLHREWAAKFEEAVSLSHTVRVLVLLLAIALLLPLLMHSL